MSVNFPGTVIEVSSIEKGSSRQMFDGIFAAGGITLAQVSIMTGLEPYMIQNWVKRGFLTSPVRRMYSKEQFSRIAIINMLRETLHIERICTLIQVIGGVLDDDSDDLISDDELYHRYVDMLSSIRSEKMDRGSVAAAAQKAVEDFVERQPGSKKQLVNILEVMLYAHAASQLRKKADEIFMTMSQ